MPSSTVTCPACGHSRQVPTEKLPKKAVTVNCPICKQPFLYTPPALAEAPTAKSRPPVTTPPVKASTVTPPVTKPYEPTVTNNRPANSGLGLVLALLLVLVCLVGGRLWLENKAQDIPFPYWLSTSEQGVALLYGDRYYVIDFDGTILRSQQLPKGTVPCQVSWHGDEIWVSDWENDCILQFGAAGLTTIPLKGPRIGAHLNVAVDNDSGNWFVSDSEGSRVAIYRPDGSYIDAFGQMGLLNGQMLFPKDIAFDDDGLLIVGNTRRGAVDAFSTDGRYVKTLAVPKGKPGYGFLTDFAISRDSLATIECDMLVNDCVVAAYDRRGNLLNTQPRPPANAAGDVAIWDGVLYVSDCLNRQLLAYDAQTLQPYGSFSAGISDIGMQFNKDFARYKALSKGALVLMLLCLVAMVWVYLRAKRRKES